MIFGVAGGLARYLNIDSSIVRLVWVLLVLAAGTGILLYILAAVLIPEEPAGSAREAGGRGAEALSHRSSPRRVRSGARPPRAHPKVSRRTGFGGARRSHGSAGT